LCNFLHSSVTSSLLGPNTLLKTQFSIPLRGNVNWTYNSVKHNTN
jgi:hypothetical protein